MLRQFFNLLIKESLLRERRIIEKNDYYIYVRNTIETTIL